jgi:hypothetical protein
MRDKPQDRPQPGSYHPSVRFSHYLSEGNNAWITDC